MAVLLRSGHAGTGYQGRLLTAIWEKSETRNPKSETGMDGSSLVSDFVLRISTFRRGFRGGNVAAPATRRRGRPTMTSNQNLDREVLLERARVGDTAAMGALFELCRPFLTLLARLSVGRRLQ